VSQQQHNNTELISRGIALFGSARLHSLCSATLIVRLGRREKEGQSKPDWTPPSALSVSRTLRAERKKKQKDTELEIFNETYKKKCEKGEEMEVGMVTKIIGGKEKRVLGVMSTEQVRAQRKTQQVLDNLKISFDGGVN